MSFKSFMQTQRDDLPPETFQRMYEQYHLHYLDDFSQTFFRASVGEEWFQDRYDPLRLQDLETEAASWAARESAAFKALLLENPAKAVEGLNLDPSSVRLSRFPATKAPVAKVESKVEGDAETGETDTLAVEDPVSKESKEGGTAKHFSGHEQRTVYLSGVHACCTKAVLKAAIAEALAASGTRTADQEAQEKPADGVVLPPAERILISQPVWSNKFLEKFER